MATETVYESLERMEKFMKLAFMKVGVPEEDASVCAEVLIESDKRGIDSHGLNRFRPNYIERIMIGVQNPVTNFDVLRETPTTAVIDGHDGMGHVIAKKSMQMAIEKAKKNGLGMVVVKNSTHFGIAGYYAMMAAANDMVGFVGTNARPSTAPTFGVENMLGTNPLTIGCPTDEAFPFIMDAATSIGQRGKIEQYNRIGKKLPEGWVSDSEGNPVTDAGAALKGLTDGSMALSPLGGIGDIMAGYKGYGYSTAVEILSAAFQQGHFLKYLCGADENGKPRPYGLGHWFIAINIEAFIDPKEFKKTTGDILRELRASKKAKGHDRIYTAGEKEYLAGLERMAKGMPIVPAVQKTLADTRDMLKIDFKFVWE
jgi:L-2-hydroxycarboxylate dehydrogenase (NAD+)